ncbi:hypothetical protein DPSP01_009098 [Paraphaeosphaeria sporulosa]
MTAKADLHDYSTRLAFIRCPMFIVDCVASSFGEVRVAHWPVWAMNYKVPQVFSIRNHSKKHRNNMFTDRNIFYRSNMWRQVNGYAGVLYTSTIPGQARS